MKLCQLWLVTPDFFGRCNNYLLLLKYKHPKSNDLKLLPLTEIIDIYINGDNRSFPLICSDLTVPRNKWSITKK